MGSTATQSVLDEVTLFDEQESEETRWTCDMRNPGQPPCENPVSWLAFFICTCIGASCNDHKVQYCEELRRVSFLGIVRLECKVHGAIEATVPKIITWNPI